jgi:hypothetical protein
MADTTSPDRGELLLLKVCQAVPEKALMPREVANQTTPCSSTAMSRTQFDTRPLCSV